VAWRTSFLETWRAFKSAQAATISSTFIITLTLTILGALGLIALVLDAEAREARRWITVEVFLSDDVGNRQVQDIRARLIRMGDVLDAHLVSKQEAIERFNQFFDPELIAALETNPLPRSLLVEIAESGRSPGRLEQLVEQVGAWTGVDAVQADVEWLVVLNRLVAGAVLVMVLLLVSVGIAVSIVIARTIGLGITARLYVVEVQRILGAPEWLIRRPFMIMGIIQGAIGGAFAGLLVVLGSHVFGIVPLVGRSLGGHLPEIAATGLIVLGTALGWWGSKSAIGAMLPDDPWLDPPERRRI
jgi:cell division transport system permease protein